MRIDAHHHLWSDPAKVGWLAAPGHTPLRRPFTTADLEPLLATSRIDGTILVEDGSGDPRGLPSLLALAGSTPAILAVVGWVDTRGSETSVDRQIREAFAHPQAARWLRGLRVQAQHEADDHLLAPACRTAASQLAARDRVLEIVLRPQHLPAAAELAGSHPDLTIVIDHAGKPDIADGTASSFERWHDGMAALAEHTSVTVKVSGLVTEADWHRWTQADLEPYVASLVDLFGADRLMIGSDWPVCLLASGYAEALDATERCLGTLAPQQLAAMTGENALRIYRLEHDRG